MEQERGTCEICRKENTLLERTYFHYDIRCECHSPTHSDLVRHCTNCIPMEPETTRIILRTSSIKM